MTLHSDLFDMEQVLRTSPEACRELALAFVKRGKEACDDHYTMIHRGSDEDLVKAKAVCEFITEVISKDRA